MNPSDSEKTTSPVIMALWAGILFVLFVCVVYLSIWSLEQTSIFTDTIFGTGLASYAAAILIQFLPTPLRVFAARMEDTDPDTADILRWISLGFTIVDGVTNIATFYTSGTWQNTLGPAWMQYIRLAMGLFFCVVITQAEEVAAWVLALMLEMINEVRKSSGRKSWKWTEWASKTGRQASGFGNRAQ